MTAVLNYLVGGVLFSDSDYRHYIEMFKTRSRAISTSLTKSK